MMVFSWAMQLDKNAGGVLESFAPVQFFAEKVAEREDSREFKTWQRPHFPLPVRSWQNQTVVSFLCAGKNTRTILLHIFTTFLHTLYFLKVRNLAPRFVPKGFSGFFAPKLPPRNCTIASWPCRPPASGPARSRSSSSFGRPSWSPSPPRSCCGCCSCGPPGMKTAHGKGRTTLTNEKLEEFEWRNFWIWFFETWLHFRYFSASYRSSLIGPCT